MKKILLFSVCLLLTGCNTLMCEFKSPDQMSDKELVYCKEVHISSL